MKSALFRKIFKALNEDLNMILSDDDFEEPEIDLGVHMQNSQKKINFLILKKNVTEAIKNIDFKGLRDIIENQWDGETAFYPVNNDNIKDVVGFSIKALGKKANLNWIDTSKVTNMEEMFRYSKFNGDISKWDVSNVRNMYSMFFMSDFNGDISGWDVSKVTDMAYLFAGNNFNGDISSWNVSSVKRMICMFQYSKFNGDISQWNVSNVRNMAYMFNNSRFNVDISSWNVSSVKEKMDMFKDCPIKEKYKPKFKK